MINNSTNYPNTYYAFSRNIDKSYPSLKGNIRCDVCIVGGGYTGLSTGLHLQELGYNTVLIEQNKIGWGASGRNGGQIVNGYSRDFDSIEKKYNYDTAKSLAEMSLMGGNILRGLINKHNINCDILKYNIFTATNDKQTLRLEAKLKCWQRFGFDNIQWLDSDKLKSYVNSPIYTSGLLDKSGGHLHPLNLALGEAAALSNSGGKIFENTKMIRFDTISNNKSNHKTVSKIYTANGDITANYLVLAGNAYSKFEMPHIKYSSLPTVAMMIATEKLDTKLAKTLFPKKVCVEDNAFVLDYFRLSKDNRLLFGGGVAYSGYPPKNISDYLYKNLIKVFPLCKGKKIDFSWSGLFSLTFSRLPYFGYLNNNTIFAGGYSGHGVTTSHLAGYLMAKAIAGENEEFNSFVNLGYIPFPGGQLFRVPLTVLGATWYRLRDALGL